MEVLMSQSLKNFLVFVLVLVALSITMMKETLGAPTVLEIRAVCDTAAVEQIHEARNPKHHRVSYWWKVSQAARQNAPDVSFKQGLAATIVISGVTNAELFAGTELTVTDRDSKKMNRVVKVDKVSSESIVLEKVNLGDGIMNIHLPGVAWAIPQVQVHPIGWKGTGVSYKEKENIFSESYKHRMNDPAIMPEIRVVCSS